MLAGLAEGQKNSVSMKELDIGEYCIASDACNSQQRKVAPPFTQNSTAPSFPGFSSPVSSSPTFSLQSHPSPPSSWVSQPNLRTFKLADQFKSGLQESRTGLHQAQGAHHFLWRPAAVRLNSASHAKVSPAEKMLITTCAQSCWQADTSPSHFAVHELSSWFCRFGPWQSSINSVSA